MKSHLLIFLLLGGISTAGAQVIKYDAASIPEKLRENAHVVKRFENITFEVKDVDRATYKVHRVLTVLDEFGAGELNFVEYTNKLRKIDEFEIKGYNSLGVQTEKFRKKDLNKQAGLDGLVTDYMIHYMKINSTAFPVTIEYKYEIEFTGTANYPSFTIQDSEESVEYSAFTAKVPAELDLRYREQRISLKPSVSSEGNMKVYKWQVENRPAYQHEESTVEQSSFYPSIILAPNKFRHYDTYGDMSSWNSFGKWAYDLATGLDVLPAERKAYFASLVKHAATDREKVALLYDYLQKNFRYVSIQLGIGGVKPFPASFTDEKKYGDCKGLSFYLQSALKSVGIKSYTALINAAYNAEPVSPDFPANQFDHEILCVPLKNDTIWLECTSNDAEFGVLGTFTENRNALLLTENGGVLVPTPASNSRSNSLITKTHIQLYDDGSGNTSTEMFSNGVYRDMLNNIIKMKKDDQKINIVGMLGYKQPDNFSITKKGHAQYLNVDMKLDIEKIPQFKAGNKMFLNQRINEMWRLKMPKSDKREYDYYFTSPFYKVDTTVYHLPEEFFPETLPQPVVIECEFASYSTSFSYDKTSNQLFSIAVLELKKNKIPAARYSEIKSFVEKVMSDETQKLIVKKD